MAAVLRLHKKCSSEHGPDEPEGKGEPRGVPGGG
jgi:hypothetical protein